MLQVGGRQKLVFGVILSSAGGAPGWQFDLARCRVC